MEPGQKEIKRLHDKYISLYPNDKRYGVEDSKKLPLNFIQEAEALILDCEVVGHSILHHNDGLPEVSVDFNLEVYDLHKICDKYDIPYINIYSSYLELKLDELTASYVCGESVRQELDVAISEYKEEWTPRLIDRIDRSLNKMADVHEVITSILNLLKSVDAFTVNEISGILWRHEWIMHDMTPEELVLKVLARRIHK